MGLFFLYTPKWVQTIQEWCHKDLINMADLKIDDYSET